MIDRNLMVSDMGGKVLVVSDTLHELNNDYVEIARIDKISGDIRWNITTGFDIVNQNRDNHRNYIGTVKEIIERFSNNIKFEEEIKMAVITKYRAK